MEKVKVGGEEYAVERASGAGPMQFITVTKGLNGLRYYLRGQNVPVPEDWYVLKYPSGQLSVISPDLLHRLVDDEPAP